MAATTNPDEIKLIIQDALSPYLGEYQVLKADGTVNFTTPAIWSAPPETPPNYKVVNGLEVVLLKNPQITPQEHFNNVLIANRVWTCVIVDWTNDPTKTLQQATEAFCSKFTGSRPKFRERIEMEKGLVFPQVRITFPQIERLR